MVLEGWRGQCGSERVAALGFVTAPTQTWYLCVITMQFEGGGLANSKADAAGDLRTTDETEPLSRGETF